MQAWLTRVWMGLMRPVSRLPGWLRYLLILVLVPFIIIGALLFAAAGVLVGILTLLWSVILGIRFRLFPPTAARDVSQLAGDEGDLDAVSETVADEGEPLKEHQLRKVHRDPRLLPKSKPPPNVWPRPKRKKVMTAQEADRLFAGTMRTKNRRIRDLLADEEQLARFGLPLWKSEQELAAALEISVGHLRHYSIHRDADPVCHYVTFAIPKRDGKRRLIMAPKQKLKALQRKVLRLLVDKLPVSPDAHGFRGGRSIRTAAEPHVRKEIVLKMDLKEFFPSVTFGRVRGLLVALGYSFPVATTLAVLVTEAERQPTEIDGRLAYVPVGFRHCVQGAPTSPGICNAICLRLDRRLGGLARKYGWSYTRYADDLTFSGNSPEHLTTLRHLVEIVCREEGFQVNADKTRVLRRGGRQTVVGVVVNDAAGLSRQERRRLRAVIHRLKAPSAKPATLTPRELEGKLAYLHMLNAAQAAALRRRWEAVGG